MPPSPGDATWPSRRRSTVEWVGATGSAASATPVSPVRGGGSTQGTRFRASPWQPSMPRPPPAVSPGHGAHCRTRAGSAPADAVKRPDRTTPRGQTVLSAHAGNFSRWQRERLGCRSRWLPRPGRSTRAAPGTADQREGVRREDARSGVGPVQGRARSRDDVPNELSAGRYSGVRSRPGSVQDERSVPELRCIVMAELDQQRLRWDHYASRDVARRRGSWP